MRLYGYQAGWYFFINDHLGTPHKIIDSSAKVVWHGVYEPFGKAGIYPAGITCNFRFPGQYFDAETGLYYNWNRYYDPETGRYITADPIGLDGGINLYAYVMNSPVSLTDPTGQAWWLIFVAVYEAADLLSSLYDAYTVAETLGDENASNLEKAGAVVFFAISAGTPLPGGMTGACKSGLKIGTKVTRKGTNKIEYLFKNRNDAMNWARKQLGDDAERVYDSAGKWIGWQNKTGDKVYWGHGDWGKGVGKSSFPHLNYEIGGTKGHLFLQDKITNKGMWDDFAKELGL